MNSDNSNRVIRGGSCYNFAPKARVADCYGRIPSFRFDDLGFRLSRVSNPLEQLSEVLDEKKINRPRSAAPAAGTTMRSTCRSPPAIGSSRPTATTSSVFVLPES